MKIWTVTATQYDMARDIVRDEDYEDFAPSRAYKSREAAEQAVVDELNETIEDLRTGNAEDDEWLPTKPMERSDLLWRDCHTVSPSPRLRWKFYNEVDETWYIIAEVELEG